MSCVTGCAFFTSSAGATQTLSTPCTGPSQPIFCPSGLIFTLDRSGRPKITLRGISDASACGATVGHWTGGAATVGAGAIGTTGGIATDTECPPWHARKPRAKRPLQRTDVHGHGDLGGCIPMSESVLIASFFPHDCPTSMLAFVAAGIAATIVRPYFDS